MEKEEERDTNTMRTTVPKKWYGREIPEELRAKARAALAAEPPAICENCGKRVAPSIWFDARDAEGNYVPQNCDVNKFSVGKPRLYHGLWCSMVCALRFATASHRGGYRRKAPDAGRQKARPAREKEATT
jgi:hypothetical protein